MIHQGTLGAPRTSAAMR